jgi:hypothetical protein
MDSVFFMFCGLMAFTAITGIVSTLIAIGMGKIEV